MSGKYGRSSRKSLTLCRLLPVANILENHPGDSPGECANNCSFGGQCDDGNECTQDICHDDNSCAFQPVVCEDDGNICTSYDPCDPEQGCVINTAAQEGDRREGRDQGVESESHGSSH